MGAVRVLSNGSLLSPSISLNPEISRRLRGLRDDEDAGVELVRTSLACIAGDFSTTRWEQASEQQKAGEQRLWHG